MILSKMTPVKSCGNLVISFVSLVVIQTGSSLLFKGVQTADAKYDFNPAAQMVLVEVTKLCISLVLLHRGGAATKRKSSSGGECTGAAERAGIMMSSGGGPSGAGGVSPSGSYIFGLFPRLPLQPLMGYCVLASGYATNNQLTFHILT